jgi:amino acid permease
MGSMFGLYMLVLCSDMCHEPSSYYICAKKTYPYVGLLIDIVVFIKCFGVVRAPCAPRLSTCACE